MKTKVENPKVKNPRSFRRMLHVWKCAKFGCLITGPHYGMIQSHCRRCGKETYFNGTGDKWIEPWGEFE